MSLKNMINSNGYTVTDELSCEQISSAYSYLGYKCISAGDVEAVKVLYALSCFEDPPIMETIGLLQHHLTAIEIHNDDQNKFNTEFLYYWAMICLGETSRLIVRHLETATVCFEKIKEEVPKAAARLVFIELLKTTEPHKSSTNSYRLGILQKWAGNQDLFSRISLSKIIYDSHLKEGEEHSSELPTLALQLLDRPYKLKHPVAVRFYRGATTFS